MTPTPPRDDAAFPLEGTRIRGRLRGLETVWTPDRFAEVIRGEVRRGVDRAWSLDRIRSWIRTAYDLDQRSVPRARKAIDEALESLQPTRPGSMSDPIAFPSPRSAARSSSQRR